MSNTLHVLGADDLRTALPMEDAMRAMRDAFTALRRGHVDMPLRMHVPIHKSNNAALVMPAVSMAPALMGVKTLSLFPDNPSHGRPFLHGAVFLFDARTGVPRGIVEGTLLTALRTGAVSGVATQLLAKKDAKRLAIIGAGAQARTQVQAVLVARPIDEIRIYSRTMNNAVTFARELEHLESVQVTAVKTVADAVHDADVICTATAATRPVLGLGDVSGGVHINAVGSFTRDMSEIGPGLVRTATVVVDSRKAAMEEAGELIACVESGAVDAEDFLELAEVLSKDQTGRREPNDITLFKSVGLAVQDLFAAHRALLNAKKFGIGSVVPF